MQSSICSLLKETVHIEFPISFQLDTLDDDTLIQCYATQCCGHASAENCSCLLRKLHSFPGFALSWLYLRRLVACLSLDLQYRIVKHRKHTNVCIYIYIYIYRCIYTLKPSDLRRWAVALLIACSDTEDNSWLIRAVDMCIG